MPLQLVSDHSLNSPTWIISEIFSQLMYNTKCINIQGLAPEVLQSIANQAVVDVN